MIKNVPFLPVPAQILKRRLRPLLGVGSIVTAVFPNLATELEQSEAEITKEEYGAIMFLTFVGYFVFMSGVVFAFSFRFFPDKALQVSLGVGLLLAALVALQLAFYPQILVRRKVRDLERNLVFGLRTVLIQIKSGVTLFDSLRVVAEGSYGAVSKEFEKAVADIGSGTPEKEALDKIAAANPSVFFRRSLWQITNGMRAGADISDVIRESVNILTKEQALSIRKYGNKLRMLSLIYMMLGVIIPALGITFLIVLTSFPQIKITEIYFWALLGLIGISQFMFMGVVKSNRPNLLGE